MINKFINDPWLHTSKLKKQYLKNQPYSHIVMPNFFNAKILNKVLKEFPDLSIQKKDFVKNFDKSTEIKLASKGSNLLSASAKNLIYFLNSDIFLNYLQELTGIKETLISDPYLSGGGYHEIKNGGLLKIHADFNKHPDLNLDRRINLLIYLNKNWNESWGGDFQMFDENMRGPIKKVFPHFNTCVIFSTTSKTYHGHPDPLSCPNDKSRKSIALYYFSTGRPKSESSKTHSTLFKKRTGDNFSSKENFLSKINKFFKS